MFKLSVRDVSHKYERTKDLGLISLTPEQIKHVQEITFEIYKDILAVCKKHDLHVSLSGGSALGAVRHQGFIPWDDDIDVMLPRDDFEEFMKIFKSELGEKYYMACPNNKYSNQNFYVIKVIDKNTRWGDYFNNSILFSEGLCVDVLPIDYVPDGKISYYIKGWGAILLLFLVNSNMMYRCKSEVSKHLFTQTIISSLYYYFRLFVGLLINIIPYSRWCLWFNQWIMSNKKTKRVSIPSGRNHYFKETHYAEVFYPFKEAQFEDTISYVPNDVHTYLKALYGKNYMEIPPIDKREKHLCTEIIM